MSESLPGDSHAHNSFYSSRTHHRSNAAGEDSPAKLKANPRWRFIDTLRGFGVAGILLVNSVDITMVGYAHPQEDDVLLDFLYLGVQTRFVPIFVFLFGMSLWFIAESAVRRGTGRWLPLFRRLITVTLIGGILLLFYRGNVLIEYGVIGLLIFPIILATPRWFLLALGGVLTGVAYGAIGGGVAACPGLMLLGAGAGAYGLPAVLERGGRSVAWTTALAVVTSAILLVWQVQDPVDPRFTTIGGITGLSLAVAYTGLLSLLWSTSAQRLITAVFEPLGRMALTNYTLAAVVFAIIAALINTKAMTQVAPIVASAVVVLAVQSILSRLWLSRFAYGPLEWIWRVATWWAPVPLTRRPWPANTDRGLEQK